MNKEMDKYFLHTPAKNLSAILQHKPRNPGGLSRFLFCNSENLTSASFRIRQWRNMLAAIKFALPSSVFFLCTFMIVCDLYQSLHHAVSDDNEDEEEDEVATHVPVKLYTWKKMRKNPVAKYSCQIGLCLFTIAWQLASNLRCTIRIPETLTESLTKTIRISARCFMFGVNVTFLYIVCNKLWSTTEIEIFMANVKEHNNFTPAKPNGTEFFENAIRVVTTFIFSCVYFRHLEDTGKLIINLSTIRRDPASTMLEMLCKIFTFDGLFRVWIKTLAYSSILIVLLVDESSTFPSFFAFFLLNLWLIIIWTLCNAALEVVHWTLGTEIGLPLNCRQIKNEYTNNKKDITDAMCLVNESTNYLHQLAVYEFYLMCMLPSRVKGLFSLKYSNIPTGFEKCLDAAFYILDNFRSMLIKYTKDEDAYDVFMRRPENAERFHFEPKPVDLSFNEKNAKDNIKARLRNLGKMPTTTLEVANHELFGMNENHNRQLLWILLKREAVAFLDMLLSPFVAVIKYVFTKLVYIQSSPTTWSRWLNVWSGPKYAKLVNGMHRDFHIVNWTVSGIVEMTCKSQQLDEYGIGQLYLEQVMSCLLDLYETVTQTCTYLEKREGDEVKRSNSYKSSVITAYRELIMLQNNCKFGISKLHALEKEHYDFLKISKELQAKIRNVC